MTVMKDAVLYTSTGFTLQMPKEKFCPNQARLRNSGMALLAEQGKWGIDGSKAELSVNEWILNERKSALVSFPTWSKDVSRTGLRK